MYVECPRCHALYRIKPHQLSAAEGWVRCGECAHIFEAQETLSEEDQPYLEIPSPPTPDDPIKQEGIAEAEVHPATASPASLGRALEVEVHRRPTSLISTLLWSIAIVVLLALLMGQYLLSNRDQLSKVPSLRPLLSELCELKGCTLPPLRALQSIELISRKVFTPPNSRHILAMTATIDNTAPFAQPYPLLQINFSNLQGKVVASGLFKPSQYLPHSTNPAQPMPPNTPVAISVAFNDPGPQAISYEISFH